MPTALSSPPARAVSRPVSPPRRRRSRLGPGDRQVLQVYLLTRVGLWLTAYCGAWLFPRDPQARRGASVLGVWEQWDWVHFQRIAEYGYVRATEAQPGFANEEAFFPGFPMVLRGVHAVVPHWGVAGLLISLVSGAVAMVALGRIAVGRDTDTDTGAGAARGRRAVLLVLLSPCAVFLAAGYTESLFLAFALPAWLAALRGRWPLAALLTTAATATRVSGLFLAAALVVQFLVSRSGREASRRWRPLPWLALPALPALLYTWYLHTLTGDWMAWKHAQERGWNREFHVPWEAWANTWRAAFDGGYRSGYALMFQAELLAMVVGVTLLVVLLRRRRWPEATYLALSLWALGTSYWYMSLPRATLLWWPLWTSLAAWSLRRAWLTNTLVCALAPLTTVFALAFTTGRWAG
ncbi:mannosyltransferase family protein [Streptomyces lasiicapitis]|uniref:mannosyltransferase family protein n=1 Tax=Streptomyces lasiicapitis TaxID=1923961 RepID=UPI003322A4BA